MTGTKDLPDPDGRCVPPVSQLRSPLWVSGQAAWRCRRRADGTSVQRGDGTILVQHITRPEGTVVLDADVREYFPDAESVNTALRTLIRLVPQKKVRHRRAAEATAAQSS